jgi:hypothetical protein
LLSGGVAIALLLLAVRTLSTQGQAGFFHDGDSNFYLVSARSLFGDGAALRKLAGSEIPYRYGRVGFPLAAWVLALGQPMLVGWSLIVVYLGSMATIPGIAAMLLAEYQVPPMRAAFVMLTPGLLLVTGLVYAEALQIALILLACLFEARQHRRCALVTIAFAILVKETSILALLPWVSLALKRRDPRQLASCAAVLLPYALWAVWVRVRIGEFPFLAHTPSRINALRPPFVGFHEAVRAASPNHTFIVTITLLTFALGAIASWAARRYWIGPITAAFSALILCFGPSALYYVVENLRLLSVPTVPAILCLVVACSTERRADARRKVAHSFV